MNPAYRTFLAQSHQDRRDIFAAAADHLDTLPTYVEKDFWVCLTLDILYNGLSPKNPRLLFKGGTSLSKVHGLIQRFSEDIDITIYRSDLGFEGAKDPASDNLSGKRREKYIEQLDQAAREYIAKDLLIELSTIYGTLVSGGGVEIDPENDETLLIHYPSVYPHVDQAYVLPSVKIEGGARSAVDPNSRQTVIPFISIELHETDFSVGNIITIDAERTFWDKVMILHGWFCGYRDGGRTPTDRNRLSRHYYDVAVISETGVGERAIADHGLREDVRSHATKLFPRGWMKLEEAVPGGFKLVPTGGLREVLEKDYEATKDMVLGDAPDFAQIITNLESLEARLNI